LSCCVPYADVNVIVDVAQPATIPHTTTCCAWRAVAAWRAGGTHGRPVSRYLQMALCRVYWRRSARSTTRMLTTTPTTTLPWDRRTPFCRLCLWTNYISTIPGARRTQHHSAGVLYVLSFSSPRRRRLCSDSGPFGVTARWILWVYAALCPLPPDVVYQLPVY